MEEETNQSALSDNCPPNQSALCENCPPNTKKTTNQLFRLLKTYADELDITFDPDRISMKELDDVLVRFFGEVRRQDGNRFKKSSFSSIRFSIQRKMRELRGQEFDIVKNPAFAASCEVYHHQLKILTKEGLGETKPNKSLNLDDYSKLYSSGVFSTKSPVSLQRKVFFEVKLHFNWLNLDEMKNLTVFDFNIKTDIINNEYKKTVGLLNKKKGVMSYIVETGTSVCPVASFQLYVSKLNPNNKAFFQLPKKSGFSFDDGPWYSKSAIGRKSLAKMMANISIDAKLSCIYNTVSIRSTRLDVIEAHLNLAEQMYRTSNPLVLNLNDSEQFVYDPRQVANSGTKKNVWILPAKPGMSSSELNSGSNSQLIGRKQIEREKQNVSTLPALRRITTSSRMNIAPTPQLTDQRKIVKATKADGSDACVILGDVSSSYDNCAREKNEKVCEELKVIHDERYADEEASLIESGQTTIKAGKRLLLGKEYRGGVDRRKIVKATKTHGNDACVILGDVSSSYDNCAREKNEKVCEELKVIHDEKDADEEASLIESGQTTIKAGKSLLLGKEYRGDVDKRKIVKATKTHGNDACVIFGDVSSYDDNGVCEKNEKVYEELKVIHDEKESKLDQKCLDEEREFTSIESGQTSIKASGSLSIDKENQGSVNSENRLLHCFIRYCQNASTAFDLFSITKHELNEMLKSFYVNARKDDGSRFSRNALSLLRYSIQQEMKSIRGNNFDILKDIDFMSSNEAFAEEYMYFKDLCLSRCLEKYQSLSLSDISKLYSSGAFSIHNPVSLQQKVFFEILLHFNWLSQEKLKNLTLHDFKIRKDNDVEVVELVEDKVHMLATGELHCPVASFRLYVSKLNPLTACFFQRPRNRYSGFWYDPRPLRVDFMERMMKRISISAGLSTIYNNNCIRFTSM